MRSILSTPGLRLNGISSPAFYLTFWQLSTYDLSPPTSRYEEESNALRALSRHEDGLWLAAERSSDRTKRLEAVKHRQRRERFNTFITLLGQEMKEQTASRSFTIKRLAKEKNHWFSHSKCQFVVVTQFTNTAAQIPKPWHLLLPSSSIVYTLERCFPLWTLTSVHKSSRLSTPRAPLTGRRYTSMTR